MAAQVAGVEFIAISTMGCKLWELGYSETDILAIKLLIKNILLTSFLVSRFYLQRYINLEPVLKWTLMGMALTAAWMPCLIAYPVQMVYQEYSDHFIPCLSIFPSKIYQCPSNIAGTREWDAQQHISNWSIISPQPVLFMPPVSTDLSMDLNQSLPIRRSDIARAFARANQVDTVNDSVNRMSRIFDNYFNDNFPYSGLHN